MSVFEIRRLTPDDLSEVAELQAKVWQNYFLTERGLQVPLMRRTNQNLRYYLDKEPDGCFVAEKDSQIVGCNFSHVWGSVGWFGPLEVAAEHQNKGIGRELVTRSVHYLKEKGCKTIGLETMSGSHKNIAFYTKQGFESRHLSYVLFKRLQTSHDLASHITTSTTGIPRLGSPPPGLDYSVEYKATEEKALGRILITDDGNGHAIVHTYDMFEGSKNAIVKLLVASDENTASDLLAACENEALDKGKDGIFLRTYSATPPSLMFFLERGYVLQSTSIRMILEGPDESGNEIHVSCWSG